MSRRLHLSARALLSVAAALAAVGALAGCATSDGGGGGPGATADAAQNRPVDAASTASTDSGSNAIDAAPRTPDASRIDAEPGAPDAMPADAMPADAMPADAMPADAMPADACVPGWISLQDNGDFESGGTSWAQAGATLIKQYGAGYPWPTNDGTWAALLGGANNASHQLTQQVRVPDDATALRVGWALCFVTEENSGDVWDTMTVQVRGGVVEEVIYDNLDAGTSCTWSTVLLDVPSPHAGELITLSFDAQTDISRLTSFGFDSTVVQAFACP